MGLGLDELSFPLGLRGWGLRTGNTSTKPRDHLLLGAKVTRDWTMSVLEHHVLN